MVYVHCVSSLQEYILKELDGLIWIGNFVPDGSLIRIDLMIVTSRLALITEEVNLIIVFLNILQAEALVPSFREHVKGDLAANREGQFVCAELFLELVDEISADIGCLIEVLKGIAFLS